MMNEAGDPGRRLKDACLSGSVAALEALIDEDKLILNQVSSLTGFFINGTTPLHVAASFGYLDFAKALLARKPNLATELDSARCSPLHLACTEGHFEIVEELLRVNNNVCLSQDEDVQTMKYLLGIKMVKDDANVKNWNGSTALDFVEHCPNRDLKTMEILEFLFQAGLRRPACGGSNPKPKSLPDNPPPPPSNWRCKAGQVLQSIYLFWIKYFKANHTWLREAKPLDSSVSGVKQKSEAPITEFVNDTPSVNLSKKLQKLWSCSLCKVAVTCELDLKLKRHLQGRKHKAKEKAIAKLLDSSVSGVKRKSKAPITEFVNDTALVNLSKELQKLWSCSLCKVTVTCELDLKCHLQGRKHKAKEKAIAETNP
ncbi:hypothetical protein RHSIM_Rhsim02G0230700 [Rhododendron simsii]|uniref:C2H2-type domain-containing protein n=1 Tax=Rhododendron simsii TaxID=118357 RepID=A0A834LZ46_RHOSS|nr:hypothetical protein RHSIM_Rhsim02G0230700 [Rhododendron simsii]